MPATATDSLIFRDIFSTGPMRRIFSDEARVQYYLDVEAALARVQARLGIIPHEAADEIGRHCQADQFDYVVVNDDLERATRGLEEIVQRELAAAGSMSRP